MRGALDSLGVQRGCASVDTFAGVTTCGVVVVVGGVAGRQVAAGVSAVSLVVDSNACTGHTEGK